MPYANTPSLTLTGNYTHYKLLNLGFFAHSAYRSYSQSVIQAPVAVEHILFWQFSCNLGDEILSLTGRSAILVSFAYNKRWLMLSIECSAIVLISRHRFLLFFCRTDRGNCQVPVGGHRSERCQLHTAHHDCRDTNRCHWLGPTWGKFHSFEWRVPRSQARPHPSGNKIKLLSNKVRLN